MYYFYPANSVGDNVDVYVFDTGIYLQHKDLGGRAKWGTDTIDSPSPLTDQHGHGTHAAGTIGGAIFGIAKMANLIAVKVLNRRGKGSTKSIIKGAVWVEDQHLKKMSKITRANGSVANMSIGVRRSHSVNRAVESLIGSGVTTVVAAGNEFDDACKLSPASVKTAITVGCTTSSDRFCVYSNVGKCVNILAPGQGIASCGIRGPVSVTTKSGTSFSVAHVTGVVAKYISSLNSLPTPAEVKKWIEKNATKNMIAKVPKGTPNKLVFMECY
ncbi:uncharacterized protein LOC100366912 [Saccoglossus kowalevskii]|uniref:Subtilisin-like protease CPC735_031240-like n=1 Tax=Saccoglossus kowalevskii TaxID=10224 RepID=A0ABM0M9R5_SACKO|nr:PREDICTED: subtilisin-like protease CPC735_031240-like [Saccoglossus kowalevskii]